jgi:hypothetical protein
MTRAYSKLRSDHFVDPRRAGLSAKALILEVNCIVTPHGTGIGCFRLPQAYICSDLSMTEMDVFDASRELDAANLVHRCPVTDWIWVRHQLTDWPPENANVGKHFLRLAREVPAAFTFRDSFETVLKPALDGVGVVWEGFRYPSTDAVKPSRTPSPSPLPEPLPKTDGGGDARARDRGPVQVEVITTPQPSEIFLKFAKLCVQRGFAKADIAERAAGWHRAFGVEAMEAAMRSALDAPNSDGTRGARTPTTYVQQVLDNQKNQTTAPHKGNAHGPNSSTRASRLSAGDKAAAAVEAFSELMPGASRAVGSQAAE